MVTETFIFGIFLHKGDPVLHSTLGRGKVVELGKTSVMIDFDNGSVHVLGLDAEGYLRNTEDRGGQMRDVWGIPMHRIWDTGEWVVAGY